MQLMRPMELKKQYYKNRSAFYSKLKMKKVTLSKVFYWLQSLESVLTKVFFLFAGVDIFKNFLVLQEELKMSGWLLLPQNGCCSAGWLLFPQDGCFFRRMAAFSAGWLLFRRSLTIYREQVNAPAHLDMFCKTRCFQLQ